MALCFACEPELPATTHHALVLRAELPDATPLAGVRFWLAGRELGPTGNDGEIRTTLDAHTDDELRVAALCPSGYRSASESRTLRLQSAARLGSGPANTAAAAPLTLALQCTPERARAALVVHAHHGTLPVSVPILIDDEPAGQTDAHGVAHVLLHGTPRSRLHVQLDTSRWPALQPRDPVRLFELEDTDSVLLFDQTFESPKKRTARPRAPPRAHVPFRIESSGSSY
jgi:hypothetical protein